jgi:hypothetical protein
MVSPLLQTAMAVSTRQIGIEPTEKQIFLNGKHTKNTGYRNSCQQGSFFARVLHVTKNDKVRHDHHFDKLSAGLDRALDRCLERSSQVFLARC